MFQSQHYIDWLVFEMFYTDHMVLLVSWFMCAIKGEWWRRWQGKTHTNGLHTCFTVRAWAKTNAGQKREKWQEWLRTWIDRWTVLNIFVEVAWLLCKAALMFAFFFRSKTVSYWDYARVTVSLNAGIKSFFNFFVLQLLISCLCRRESQFKFCFLQYPLMFR